MLPRRETLCAAGAALAGSLLGCGADAPASARFSEQNARSVIAPSRFGWLSTRQQTEALPSAIALGGKSSGRVLLYFEFPELKGPRKLLRAQLLLSASGLSAAPVEIELSRAEPARANLRFWSDQPRVLYPRVAAHISSHAWPERIDVTEIAQAGGKRGEPLRLLLRAEPGEGEAVLVATGAAGGSAPRLELYWQ